MNKRLADQQDRDRITRELDRSFLVEAGAGSGKTTSLVDRMVALIIRGEVEVEELAALTFTRKAAGELRERFQEGLEKALKEDEEPARSRAGRALENMERGFVGTIHSFCSLILRERPVEAGLDPGFVDIDEEEEKRIRGRAWEQFLLWAQAEKPQLIKGLAGLDIKAAELEGSFQAVINFPEIELITKKVPYPQETLNQARQEVNCFLDEMEQYLPGEEPEKGWDKLQNKIRRGLRWREKFTLEGDRILLRLLDFMSNKPEVTLNRWPDLDTGRWARDKEIEFLEKTVEPALQEWHRYCHEPIINFLKEAEKFYAQLRQRENLLNYQDLLLQTARLLRDNDEVRSYFKEKYTRLLVDEFQDTDPLQAEIVLYLAGDDSGEKNWADIRPRPGALFLVGDPKQSIYRFRRADIDIYSRVKQIMEKTGGGVLKLSTNFRSLQPLVQWSNRVFSSILGQEDPPYQASYQDMDYFRSHSPEGTSPIRVLGTEKVKGNNKEEICSLEAERIASFIARAVAGELYIEAEDRTARPEDFLIIIPYKKPLVIYARALEKAGLPFTVSGGGNIQGCQELVELMPILRAISDPDNPVPLIAALRGVFFGISDQELYELRSARGNFSFLSDLPHKLEPALGSAWEQMRYFWKLSQELNPAGALARIIEELGAIPLALAAPLGRSRAGYLLQALELVEKREQAGATDFAGAVHFLEELLENGVEEEIDPRGDLVGVRLMNLHKAKGLEAPVVFLADPSHESKIPPRMHVTRKGNQGWGYLEIKDGARARPPDWDYYKGQEEKYLQAEKDRLRYVAATRAQEMLIVSVYRGKESNSFWYPLNPYLGEEPELEEGVFSPASEISRPVTANDRENFYQNQKEVLSRLQEKGFQRKTVTEMVRQGEYPQRTEITGRGAAWGNVIHHALEIMTGQNIPPDNVLQQLLQEEGLAARELTLLRQKLQEIIRSPLWVRLSSADRVIREASFGLREGDLYLTGSADLVFFDRGSWVIVDYKSDRVENEEHLQELIIYYRPQVEAYARYWERLTGEQVGEKGLFFTDKPQYIPFYTAGGGGT